MNRCDICGQYFEGDETSHLMKYHLKEPPRRNTVVRAITGFILGALVGIIVGMIVAASPLFFLLGPAAILFLPYFLPYALSSTALGILVIAATIIGGIIGASAATYDRLTSSSAARVVDAGKIDVSPTNVEHRAYQYLGTFVQ